MSLSGSLILPKFTEISGISAFLKKIYQDVQCNQSVDAIWEGAAVIFNQGANEHVKSKIDCAGWGDTFREMQIHGGIDNRVGVVTQYEDQESVDLQNQLYQMKIKPWVRISSYINCYQGYKACLPSSISIEARFCSVVPMEFLLKAREIVISLDIEVTNNVNSNIEELDE